jgi:hypothetical protein
VLGISGVGLCKVAIVGCSVGDECEGERVSLLIGDNGRGR